MSLYNQSSRRSHRPDVTLSAWSASSKRPLTSLPSPSNRPAIPLVLLGELGDELGASHYLKVLHGRKEGAPRARLRHARKSSTKASAPSSAPDSKKRARLLRTGPRSHPRRMLILAPNHQLGADIDFGDTGPAPRSAALQRDPVPRGHFDLAMKTPPPLRKSSPHMACQSRALGTVTAGSNLAIKADGTSFEWDILTLLTAWADTIGNLMA